MRRKGPRHYWDACIFLAWLHDDWAGVPGVMEGIEEIAKEVHENRAVLFTSVVTKTEVLEHRLKPRAKEMFTRLFMRHNVSYVNHDERVGDLSHAIRDHYAGKPEPERVVYGTQDCIHLATAILYEADCFYTLDGAGPRKRKADLLLLNGNVMGHALKIAMPSGQPSLFSQPVPPVRAIKVPPKSGGDKT